MRSVSVLLALALLAGSAAGEEPGDIDAARVETTFGPVYRSQTIPPGHYAERYAEGAYWLPGVAEGSSLVRKVIRAARESRAAAQPARLRVLGSVYVSEGPPFAGVYRAEAEGRFAWMAGVRRGDPELRAALEAALATY